jgi:hypothetical protein
MYMVQSLACSKHGWPGLMAAAASTGWDARGHALRTSPQALLLLLPIHRLAVGLLRRAVAKAGAAAGASRRKGRRMDVGQGRGGG